MLSVGVKGNRQVTVTKEMLACSVGSGDVKVYATPMMVAEIEETAASSVAPLLEEGKVTVGTLIQVKHVAATPEGMKVRFETELTDISKNGKFLTFRVSAYDEKELIGEGIHSRAVVDQERFEKKTAEKLKAE